MLEMHLCVINNNTGRSSTFLLLLLFKHSEKLNLNTFRSHLYLFFTTVLMSKLLGRVVCQHRQTSEMQTVTSAWYV